MDRPPEEIRHPQIFLSGGEDILLLGMTDTGSHKTCPTDNIDEPSSPVEEVVSKIIVESCLPKPFKKTYLFQIWICPSFTSGSEAEFYIKPSQSCVGDEDTMYYNCCEIAFSGKVPWLPADARRRGEKVVCYRLESYAKYPGFVRMKCVGEMKYYWNLNKYEFHEAPDTKHYFVINDKEVNGVYIQDDNSSTLRKGPAVSYSSRDIQKDTVFSVYCPQWPTEAKDWFYRSRSNGWPTKANLHTVANMGCHVVYVQHRDCRDDEYQWRFSFSLAELVLIRSWTKTQQIVYHMLRFFAKKELIQKDCPKEKEILCTYHLKTLMLWTCEQESPKWWNSSVIGLCSKLLHKLLEWLKQRHFPNYFIPEANLFYEQFDLDIYQAITECIQRLNSPELLSQWFLHNYLLPYFNKKGWMIHIAQDDSLTYLFRIARIITLAKKTETLNSFDTDFFSRAIGYSLHFNQLEFFTFVEDESKYHSFISAMLPMKVEKSSTYSISLAYMLRAANAILCKRVLCYKTHLSLIITILLRLFRSYWPKCNNFPINYETRFHKRYVYFLKAQEYMANIPASVTDPEFQLLSRLSMEFLRKSVTGNDAISEAIRCATYAYMAANCYITSQYQSAVQLCSEILTNPVPFGSSTEPLSGGCLIFIDDVSNIIGYLLLWRYVLDRLHDRYSEINLDLRLSPEVFAQYILIQSIQRMSPQLYPNWNKIYGEFLMDALLIAVMKRKLRDVRNKAKSCLHAHKLCVYRRSRSVNELINHVTSFPLNEDMSIRLLMECSLKNMTSLYEDTLEEFCFPFNTLAFCYRVVYHYRCHHYDEVMTLCEQMLCKPDIGIEHKEYPFLNVMVLPPFTLYFDDDVQSLLGLQTLCLILFHKSEDILSFHKRPRKCGIYCFFMEVACLRRLFSLGRHFLARYLHLRCLIDTNGSMSEVRRAFGKLKCRLHFEYIVHTFLLQKLKKTVKYCK